MFYSFNKTDKKIVSVILFFVFYFVLSLLFLLTDKNFIASPSFDNFFKNLLYLWWLKIIIDVLFIYLFVWLANNSLDIRSKVVGDGQHGTSRWIYQDEKVKTYKGVDFGQEIEPGILVGVENNKWLIDTSDQTCICLAPPGGGKTLRELVPTVVYNAKVNKNTGGKGASQILTDCKGDLYRKTCNTLIKNGVKPLLLDFRSPLNSLQFNLMENVNQKINEFKNTKDKKQKLIAYAKAEKYSKILSSSIVDNLESNNKSDASAYFNDTAKGLITALILLVSEYAEQPQRHIISVFRLIIELNGLSDDSNLQEGLQKNKMKELLSMVDNDRLINYAGSSIEADVRTTMNIYSSAISKLSSFIDAELEQLVCNHSPEINVKDFIKNPTAIFLVCPDENTTRHFFASLFIRYFINDLLELAETEHNGILPRQVLCLWDEFGNQPPIKDIQLIFTAVRSRNIRLVISLQSYEQLTDKYTQSKAKIIRESCQMTMFTYVSPNSITQAKEFSEILGKQTVSSGSVSSGKGYSNTRNMMGRPLLYPDEIIGLEPGSWIVMKNGVKPMKSNLPICFDYIGKLDEKVPKISLEVDEIDYLTSKEIQRKTNKQNQIELFVGMFD